MLLASQVTLVTLVTPAHVKLLPSLLLKYVLLSPYLNDFASLTHPSL